jgi:hypothetical protein
MGRLRDRWADRGPVDEPVAELDRLGAHLHDKEDLLAFAVEAVVEAEEAEKALAGFAEELFSGVLAPDVHDRRRAETTHLLMTTRRNRDDLQAVVEAGRRACEKQHALCCEQQRDACDAERDVIERDLADAMQRVRGLEALAQLVEERRYSFTYSEPGWLKLKARYDRRTAERLEERRTQPPPLPPETVEEQQSRIVDDVLAVRTIDPDSGLEVAAYSRLGDAATRIG